jgi:2,3,4,5-tetrahydropyridine-2-carboxylate N-succinyltransferase
MMADAGDEIRLDTGVDRTGLMFSILSATTKIVDRKTGQVHIGKVPPYSVVVPGSLPDPHGVGPSLYCAVIVKTVDAQTRSKTSINDLLRD